MYADIFMHINKNVICKIKEAVDVPDKLGSFNPTFSWEFNVKPIYISEKRNMRPPYEGNGAPIYKIQCTPVKMIRNPQ